jgi:ATP-dependent Clp protease, protease subunit
MPKPRKPNEAPKNHKAAQLNRFRAEHKADGKELHLYALGPIADALWWGDEVTPKAVIDALNDKGEAESIHVHINSYGGSVFAGIAIFNLLRNSGLRVVASVEGIAASAASLILMAGDERRVPENAFVMIHNPWTFAMGESDDLRKTADVLDQIQASLVSTYARRSGLSEDKVKTMLDAETWLNGAAALTEGLATHTDAAMELAAAVRPFAGRAASLPPELAAAMDEDEEEEDAKGEDEDEDDAPPPPPEETDEEVEEAPEAPTETPEEEEDEEEDDEEKAKALAAAVARAEAAEAKLGAMRTSAVTAKVDAALAEGRIRATGREVILKAALANEDPDAFLAALPRAGGAEPLRLASAAPAPTETPLDRVIAIFKSKQKTPLN